MTTGLTYTTYKNLIAELAVVSATNDIFLAVLPQCITYAENRMCRDLDFLSTSTALTGSVLTVGNRQLTIAEGSLVVTEEINIIMTLKQLNGLLVCY